MATFLSQPQPGDCTWLPLLAKVTDDNNGNRDGEVQSELADAGGDVKNFIQESDNSKKGPAQQADVPRTVVVEESPQPSIAAASTLAPALPNFAQHLPSGSSNYTSQRPRDMEDVSRASMGPKKSLPPHLARKLATSNEQIGASADASVISRNGSTRNADPATGRPRANNSARGRGNVRGGRGGRGGGNSFAAARAEIPKVDPNRWKTDWTARKSWDSSSINTARASSGWGTKKERTGKTASPPVADWSGKLAPPPPDWDSRPGFRVNQSYKQIMDWMGEIEIRLCAVPEFCVPLNDVIAADGTTFVFRLSTLQPDEAAKNPAIKQMGEIVPRYWVPMIIGPQAPQVFWNELLKSAPPPDDPIDLEGAKPWWERFVKSEDSCLNFLKEPPFPTIIGVDPEQEDAEQALKRKHDRGSKYFADNRRRYELECLQEKVEKQRRIAEKQRNLAAMEATSSTPTNHNRIKPGFKLYVRSARADDMDAVKDIYNYYIENTTSVSETDRLSREQMVERYRAIRLLKMPFLVAYKPGGIVRAPRKKKNQTNHPTRDDVQLPDTIVGFAFADDYNDSRGMYRFTAEVEFYTKETEYMNGVASCLVDRLMVLLDPTYQDRGGYEALGDDIDGLGVVRIIKNIVINLPFEKPERLEWVGRWLEGWLKFKEVGILETIGTKNGKAVSLALFQRETGATLDHANAPSGLIEF